MKINKTHKEGEVQGERVSRPLTDTSFRYVTLRLLVSIKPKDTKDLTLLCSGKDLKSMTSKLGIVTLLCGIWRTVGMHVCECVGDCREQQCMLVYVSTGLIYIFL